MIAEEIQVETEEDLPLLTKRELPIIMNIVSEVTGVSYERILKYDRTDEVAFARHLFAGVSRKITTAKLKEIGDYIKRDHTSIINSVGVLSDLIETHEGVQAHYNEIMNRIKEIYKSRIYATANN